MSHWNGGEIQDIFGNEDNGVINLFPFQEGEEVLESVTFSDSHKKPRYLEENDVRTSIYCDGSATDAALPNKDARVLSTDLKEGNSKLLDPLLPFISEKEASILSITKCSPVNSSLDCQGDKISSKSIREGENDTGNKTLCLDYGNRGDVHDKNVGDVSSADTFVGIPAKEQMSRDDDLLFYDYPSIGHFEDFERMFRNHGPTFAQGSTVTEDEMSWFSSSSHGFHGVEDTLQSVVLSSVSASSAFNNASTNHGLSINVLPGTKTSVNGPELPSETTHKSLLSELAYDHAAITGKSLTLEQISYDNDCRNSNMNNGTLKDLSTAKGKKIDPIQCSLSGCGLIQNVQDQELLSSFLPSAHPFSESFASNCLHSHNSQAQMSEMLKSTIIKSSVLPDYMTSKNLPSHAHHSMGMLPGPFSIPSMPLDESKTIYPCKQFPTAWVVDKPLEQRFDKAIEQHEEASDSSPQRKYKFGDVVEGDKALNIDSSTLQEKSCMTNTFIDDLPLKAVIIQQLQMIMDRLGVRTKLCIRDSLYRLARSAEQSHCYGSANNVSRASSPMRGFQDSKRPPEYLGFSINTNEIERAVAYLLFHKSLGPGTGTADC